MKYFTHEPPPGAPEGAQHAPATLRNRDPILAVLRQHLPIAGLVLETASGSGEHTLYFAEQLPHLQFQPSDPDPGNLISITSWQSTASPANLRAPIQLDVCDHPWPITMADALLNINMIHIAPWSACQALMKGAARVLPPGGVLYTYGPYKRNGDHTSESNAAFDDSLRGRNPAWGVRDMADVQAEADANQFDLYATVPMPANNFSLVFHRR